MVGLGGPGRGRTRPRIPGENKCEERPEKADAHHEDSECRLRVKAGRGQNRQNIGRGAGRSGTSGRQEARNNERGPDGCEHEPRWASEANPHDPIASAAPTRKPNRQRADRAQRDEDGPGPHRGIRAVARNQIPIDTQQDEDCWAEIDVDDSHSPQSERMPINHSAPELNGPFRARGPPIGREGEDGIKRRFVTVPPMAAFNLRPSFELDGLQIHGVADDDDRPYIVGDPRNFRIIVENLGTAERRGKLVLDWASGQTHWARILSLALGAHETRLLTLEQFVPPTEGVYEFRVAAGSKSMGVTKPWLEFFDRMDEDWLKSTPPVSNVVIGSFRVHDAHVYSELVGREARERNRWLVLAIFTGIAAAAGVILLLIELTNLGWIHW